MENTNNDIQTTDDFVRLSVSQESLLNLLEQLSPKQLYDLLSQLPAEVLGDKVVLAEGQQPAEPTETTAVEAQSPEMVAETVFPDTAGQDPAEQNAEEPSLHGPTDEAVPSVEENSLTEDPKEETVMFEEPQTIEPTAENATPEGENENVSDSAEVKGEPEQQEQPEQEEQQEQQPTTEEATSAATENADITTLTDIVPEAETEEKAEQGQNTDSITVNLDDLTEAELLQQWASLLIDFCCQMI